MRALLRADGVLAAFAAVQRQERGVRAQRVRQIGEQRGSFVIGMGYGKQDARHHARFLNRFERVRDALAAARRGRFLLRGNSRQAREQRAENGQERKQSEFLRALHRCASAAAANGQMRR